MSRSLDDLKPYVKELAQRLVGMCEKEGIKILIYETYRSIEEQNKLYAKGRTVKGKIVTNAKGGSSYHNFRLAFDVVPMIDGKCAWGRNDLYKKIGALGKSIGLEWGGDFKSIKDMPHFQYSGGLSLSDLRKGKNPIFPK